MSTKNDETDLSKIYASGLNGDMSPEKIKAFADTTKDLAETQSALQLKNADEQMYRQLEMERATAPRLTPMSGPVPVHSRDRAAFEAQRRASVWTSDKEKLYQDYRTRLGYNSSNRQSGVMRTAPTKAAPTFDREKFLSSVYGKDWRSTPGFSSKTERFAYDDAMKAVKFFRENYKDMGDLITATAHDGRYQLGLGIGELNSLMPGYSTKQTVDSGIETQVVNPNAKVDMDLFHRMLTPEQQFNIVTAVMQRQHDKAKHEAATVAKTVSEYDASTARAARAARAARIDTESNKATAEAQARVKAYVTAKKEERRRRHHNLGRVYGEDWRKTFSTPESELAASRDIDELTSFYKKNKASMRDWISAMAKSSDAPPNMSFDLLNKFIPNYASKVQGQDALRINPDAMADMKLYAKNLSPEQQFDVLRAVKQFRDNLSSQDVEKIKLQGEKDVKRQNEEKIKRRGRLSILK